MQLPNPLKLLRRPPRRKASYSTPTEAFIRGYTPYHAQTQNGAAAVAQLLGVDPMTNSVVMAAITRLMSSLETIRFGVARVGAPDDAPLDYAHPAVRALETPVWPWSRRDALWQIVEGVLIAGNAVLIPRPDGVLPVDWRNVRLPLSGMNRYEVTDGFTLRTSYYAPEGVAHLRHHMSRDGVNGLGVVNAALLDELRTDREAQQYTLTILANMGVPGIIVTPGRGALDDHAGGVDDYTQEDIDELKRQFLEQFSGGWRGGVAAFTRDWNFQSPPTVSTNSINLSHLRNVCEERLLAALGVPPALLGIGTGAEQTRVGATVDAMRLEFAHATLKPLADLVAQQLTRHFLPFYAQPGVLEFRLDCSGCSVLQEAAWQTIARQSAMDSRAARELAGTPEPSQTPQLPPA